ncbi:ral GTPase-activating protein subunit beta isoform X3 [Parambassis ranga]|uniref:Ral GTPase-activating protein subunit beta isoform X3 n=1 Tax=Parambassis ranga TaxID=210632 RepID=A0A6P7K770_9TELE|nr:ral GTPase-activating protein subunit beta-like isoform X3 [Parambassis ranga]
MDQLLSGLGHVSVLSCFPPSVGRDVATAVVKPLAAGLGNPDTCSLLGTDRQVKWTMEVLSYGLTLPLDEDTVKLCVHIYTDWLMALVSPRDSTPPPISRDPNLYVQMILRHLYSLFLNRSDQGSLGYLSLCQQVLCAVQYLAKESSVMSRDTWEAMLHFLLRVNHAMLASPSAAGHVSNLSMAVLLEVWLLSCSRCFPSCSLWQSCRQMLSSWRHQPAVALQLSRVVAALTSRMLLLTFGPSFPHFKVPDEDAALIPADMHDEQVPHTWFRFLHLFSDLVDFRCRAVFGSTSLLQEEVLSGEDSQLPNVFFSVMRVVGTLVDAFLGVTVLSKGATEQLLPSTGLTARMQFRDQVPSLGVAVTRSPFRDHLPSYGFSRPRSGSAPPTPVNSISLTPPCTTSSPPHNRRLKAANVSKANSKPPSASSFAHPWKSSQLPPSPPPLCSSLRSFPSPLRCSVDSLLHLFGCWLFDAALISRNTTVQCDVMRSHAIVSERWAAGQAEACGTLCRIFSSKRTAENILPVYLSRFYLVLLNGLQPSEEVCPAVLASILLNSTCLFCCDLKGVNLLFQPFMSALETVLFDRELVRFRGFVNLVDLRRASILILLSLLPVPLQFGSVQSEVVSDGKSRAVAAGGFLTLKPRLINAVIGALQTEMDSCNIQLILAAMLNLVQDSSLFEGAGQTHHEPHRGTQRPRPTRGSNAAAVLWVQIVRLLTRFLTSQWKNDSAVCLSALEVLGGLAKVQVWVEDSERRRAVSSICTYIEFLCSRPPPLHSRDLHSIIVAAFHCLTMWFIQHPALLDHQECLLEVLEIVELGISGSKSRQKQEVKRKEEKELNPASLRVKEAAEATLSCVMQVSGAFPLVGHLLNEDSLICCSGLSDIGLRKFRYFVVESSVILAILEHGPVPEQEPNPSLTMLIRGPSGCHTWSLQLHMQPRDSRTHTQSLDPLQQPRSPERCRVAQGDTWTKCGVKHPLFPENPDMTPQVQADLSVPALHEMVSVKVPLDHLRAALKRQHQIEARQLTSQHSDVIFKCSPPRPATCFQTARLLLSHLGLLTPESIKDPGLSGVPAQLMSLDSSLPGFSESLRRLDQLSSRNCDSAFIFYIKAGQKTAAEIFMNVESRCSVQSHFLDFLSSLGRPLEVGQQQVDGPDGSHSEFPSVLGGSGGGVFDGQRFVLRFTDALTEITFIVPSPSQINWSKTLEQEPLTELPSNQKKRRPDIRPDSVPKSSGPTTCPTEGTKSHVSSLSESKLLIVWVERFEDIESFPLSDLLSEMRTQTERSVFSSASNVQLIFIHPLRTGLYRICFQGNRTSKFSQIIPLVSGSVVSKGCLGFLVREMVINCCNRRRLESDSAPWPHIRRKHMISDIVLNYRSRQSEPGFYSDLFHNL